MTENQTHDLDLRSELEVANILNEQKEAENAQSLFTAIVTGATDRITTKHDPWCDCGICQYCRGDEDKFGDPTDRSVIEINSIRQSMKMIAAVECSECDEAKTESIPLNGDLLSFRLEFSKTAWKYGWIVEASKVLCPNCREDAEEWRSI